ncbi:MAG: LptF/LptG family permease [Myxococcaceae bacterium]|nr:LptF/LptG family permease [Myxococcaceae bacterium]MCI0669777.1 LptF/LptG family permease [Myxococcaceae bacterium]
MSRTLIKSLCRQYAATFVAVFAAVVAVFLVADFVDNARSYKGSDWVADVALLYGYKALVVGHQLAPAALLLAAGMTVSALRRRGELTALKALGFPPHALLLPVGLCALAVSAGMVVFDERVVVGAARRVEELSAQRFNRGASWDFSFTRKEWFRVGDRFFELRQGDADTGFAQVTVLTLTPEFTLARRVDAERMESLGGTRWRLSGVTDRRFSTSGASTVSREAEGEYDLGVDPSAFRIRLGRPEHMRLKQLQEQIHARSEVGLASQQFALALHNRFAYPLAGLPAALLAVLLAVRPGRRGHLTTALVEGLGVSVGLWGVMVACRTLVASERLAPALAAWLPCALLLGVATLLWLRREGQLGGGAG